jgi:hypothetical protein
MGHIFAFALIFGVMVNCNVIMGHVHRLSMFSRAALVSEKKKHLAATLPCMCTVAPKYARVSPIRLWWDSVCWRSSRSTAPTCTPRSSWRGSFHMWCMSSRVIMWRQWVIHRPRKTKIVSLAAKRGTGV